PSLAGGSGARSGGQDQAVIIAYTGLAVRSLAESASCAKRQTPRPDWTGSRAPAESRPSAHLSAKTGGRVPTGALTWDDQRMTLFTVSTIVIVTTSVDRSDVFLYAHRSPTFHTLSFPSTRPFGLPSSLL